MTLRILFVEDDTAAVAPVQDALKKAFAVRCDACSFEDVEERIGSFRPDVVILDLLAGPEVPGAEALARIFNATFRPIVVYSANPDAAADAVPKNPFIRYQKKGAGSDRAVVEHVRSFESHIRALQSVEEEIDNVMRNALRDVGPFAFGDDLRLAEGERALFLKHCARRRVAALMDQETISEGGIATYGQYLVPPFHKTLLTGDLIRRRAGNPGQPEDYLVVLTPSCDLEQGKVLKILAAKCKPARELIHSLGLTQAQKKRIQEQVLKVHNDGYANELIILPSFPGRWPPMVASLRDLDVIGIDRIALDASGEEEYRREASIDSPFREAISWNLARFAGRPGLPKRNTELSAAQYADAFLESRDGKG